jgi:phosphoribosylformimino-5-aminoimidazole carboxamide ribotide isomerase
MRLIPVIDLLNNRAVHAVKGERKHYKPVVSVLCASSEPLEIARAFRDHLGLDEIYVADLNAIEDFERKTHSGLIERLSSREKFRVLLDAGISDAREAWQCIDTGISKIIIGSETLKNQDALQAIPCSVEPDRLVFSLDCRNGKILTKCPELAALSPIEALEYLRSSGWREVILLDLARVGSGQGIDRSLIMEARASFPKQTLLVGGGITGPEELDRLQSLGIGGVLAATALHKGTIGPQHLSGLNQKPSP